MARAIGAPLVLGMQPIGGFSSSEEETDVLVNNSILLEDGSALLTETEDELLLE